MDEQKQPRSGFVKGLIIGVLITLALVVVLFLILEKKLVPGGLRVWTDSETEQLDVTNPKVSEKLLEMETLINYYYLDEIDGKKVEDMIYTGLIYGLGDPYAAYYSAEEYDSVQDSTKGSYCGIGAMFSQNMVTGLITVVKVYEGFPAMEAGLLPGDVLYAVEDEPAAGQDLTNLVGKIKGEEGTFVKLTMIREGQEDYVEVQVERRPVEVPTIEYEMLEDHIGYIVVSEFDAVTSQQFKTALEELEVQGMEGLIVDLRNNGGGLMQTVAEMADEMVPEGLIVYTENKYGQREELHSAGETVFEKPLAVLVNGNTASASEIFAGAVQDHEVGVIVGTQTYGKGIVQKSIELDDGTAIRLTISKYFTPNGNDIHGVGITPDVKVELDEELKFKPVISREEDKQLQKAVEVLMERMQ